MRRYIAVLAIVGTGCSFALVSGPPPNHPQVPAFECTTGRAGPILDTVLAGVAALTIVNIARSTDQQWHDMYCTPGDMSCNAPVSRGAAVPIYAVLAALGGAGMYYGYTTVGQCNAAKEALAMRAIAQPPIGTWPPPPGWGAPPGPGPGSGPGPGPEPGSGSAPAPAAQP